MSEFKPLPHHANGVDGDLLVPDEDGKKRRRFGIVPRTRKFQWLTFVIVCALGASMASYAVGLWTTSNSGSANAKAGTLVAPTVVAATTPIGSLFPATPGPIYVKVTNPNAGALVLTAATPNGTQTPCTAPNVPAGCLVTSSDQANCPSSGIFWNGVSGQTISIPPGTTDNIAIPGAATLAAGSPTLCQGVTFTIAASLVNAYTFTFNTP